MGRIIAIDYGKKRSGIAVTDTLQIVANGLTTVPTHTLLNFIKDYVSTESVDRIVVGLPKQMNNQPSENMKRIQPFVNRMRKELPEIPIEMYDERFTSVLAHRAMIDGGIKKMARRDKAIVDENNIERLFRKFTSKIMILPIYLYGQPVLRKEAEEVEPDYPELNQLIADMYETMQQSDGVGLAAPQIGLSKRLIVIDADVLKESFPELAGVRLTLINPELDIIEDGKKVTREEGCLSIPGLSEPVARFEKVKLNWLDENFNEHEQVFEGYLARIIQHEYDHLDGILYVDKISPIRKQLIRNKLRNIADGKVACDYKIKQQKHKR